MGRLGRYSVVFPIGDDSYAPRGRVWINARRRDGGVTVAFSSRSVAFVSGYRAVAHLERGDLCDVYSAWSEEREARCVVKILRPDRRAFAADRRRVVAEGALLLSLTHPHIVRAYEVHEDPVPFIVLEAASGESLARLIELGPFATRDLARLATQLCSALGYLHRQGYLHLDLMGGECPVRAWQCAVGGPIPGAPG
jgi:serine/threonine protein kinase